MIVIPNQFFIFFFFQIYESIIKSPKVALSKASRRDDPFFAALEDSGVFVPRGESSLRAGGSAHGGGAERFNSESLTEKYAAPATSSYAGALSYDRPYYSRYG